MEENKEFSYSEIFNRIENSTEETEEKPTFQIDEVASVFFGLKRLQEKENIEHTFEGYKVGAIYLFVMDLIRNHIEQEIIGAEPCTSTDSFIEKVLKGKV